MATMWRKVDVRAFGALVDLQPARDSASELYTIWVGVYAF